MGVTTSSPLGKQAFTDGTEPLAGRSKHPHRYFRHAAIVTGCQSILQGRENRCCKRSIRGCLSLLPSPPYSIILPGRGPPAPSVGLYPRRCTPRLRPAVAWLGSQLLVDSSTGWLIPGLVPSRPPLRCSGKSKCRAPLCEPAVRSRWTAVCLPQSALLPISWPPASFPDFVPP